MKSTAIAIRELFDAIDLEDALEGIRLLAAIDALCLRLDQDLKSKSESLPKAGYVQEKVELFRSCCWHALVPQEGTDHKTPDAWMGAAKDSLLKVQFELSGV
ncbi:hypothetical protein [Luteolibacter soli]|uniref:Uncharacterized protein n=1 Tax=Luteolibacter soli TaxID=3135280 RepID=A0ABU9B1K0_9BACT